ncbi:hypothetical protein D3C73_1272460 [compost metagenome]
MRHPDNRPVIAELSHTRNKREAIIEEMRIDLGLQLLQSGFPHMDFLHQHILNQLLRLLHHIVKPPGQEAEFILAFNPDADGIITLLQTLKSADQLPDRHLYLHVQDIGDHTAH